MDAAELKKLQESVAAQSVQNAKLLERALRGDARELATQTLRTVELPEASKSRVIEAALRDLPRTEAGELDAVKFTEAVNVVAKSEAAYVASLTGAGRVFGMGGGNGAPVVEIDAKETERRAAAEKNFRESSVDVFTQLCGGNKTAGEAAALKGAA